MCVWRAKEDWRIFLELCDIIYFIDYSFSYIHHVVVFAIIFPAIIHHHQLKRKLN